jgi:Predicted membrane protein
VAGALRGRVFGGSGRAAPSAPCGSGKSKGERSNKIALEQSPNGSIKSAEIENEKGHLVWSFDISEPGTRNITELLVDAKTGKIVSILS